VTLRISHFESLYASDPDPWNFDGRWYEQRKHELTVASLPAARYQNCFELGCSNGSLTALLAPRCSQLLAVDAVAAAVDRARERLRPHPQVRVERRHLPEEWPIDRFDLIVVSEFLYYFSVEDLERIRARVEASLLPGGTLVACHWRHPVAEHPVDGDRAQASLNSLPSLRRLARHEELDFLLEVMLKVQPDDGRLSVAAATGVPGA